MRFSPKLQGTRQVLRTAALGVVVLLAVSVLGATFFLRGRAIMEERLKQHLRDTAAVAAQQFDAATLDDIDGPEDMESAAFRDVVTRLRNIREEIPNIRFAYLMRRTEEPLLLTFIADADSLAGDEELDRNHNASVEEAEEASYPGDPYDITDVPALQGAAFSGPAVDEEITVDQWGKLISGYAPIRRQDGTVAAVLGVDMAADDYLRLAQSIFSPVALLLVVLAGIFLAAYVFLYLRRREIEKLREIDRQRLELMELASHQLGAPLAIVRWWVDILREHGRTERSVKEHAEIVAELQEGIDRMDSIVTTLQEARNVAHGDMHYTPVAASLREVIERVAREFQPLLARRRQRLALTLGQDTDQLRLDPTLIAGVLRELLDNASVYSKAETTISLRTVLQRDAVRVEVRDQGYGIAAADLPHVTEKFVRGRNAQTYKPVGNGLGLYIARGIIERAGGTLTVDSIEGKGTTVTFTLPLSP